MKNFHLKSIKKGNIIFDIGANVGTFTELFSILCGSKGEVHCFEPITETYEALLRRTENLKNVHQNNVALVIQTPKWLCHTTHRIQKKQPFKEQQRLQI